MSSSTRQVTPGSSRLALEPLNAKKRGLSEEGGEAVTRDVKKLKKEENDRPEIKDKRKRKKKKRKLPVVVENDGRSRSKPASSASATVVILSRAASPASANIKPASRVLSGDAKSASHLFHMNVDAPGEDVLTLADPASTVEQQASAVPVLLTIEKGKAKASDAIPPDGQREGPSSSESAGDKIIRLTQELKVKDELVKKHENVLTQVQQSITCQICLDPMYKPYALAPCGHLACYDCLVRWFTTPSPDGQIPPPSSYLRKKTCPHCRAEIKQRPVEIWGVKSIVNGLIKSGLLSGLNRPAAMDVNANENGAPPDPWHRIFRKPIDHGHPFFGPAVFPPPQAGIGGHDMGMYDAEDGGIYRCLDCMHEIWEGVCSGCHRIYHGHGHDHGVDLVDALDILDQEDDDDVEVDVDDDDDDGHGEHFNDILGWYQGPFPAHAPHVHIHHYPPGQYAADFTDEEEGGVARLDEVESGDDENEEEGYESSFIDDDNDRPRPRRTGRQVPQAEVINVDESDSDSDDDPPPVTRARRGGLDLNHANVSDGGGGGSSQAEVARVMGRIARVRQNSDGLSDEYVIGPRGRPSIHSASRRVVGSDLDELSETSDEDEEPSVTWDISQSHIIRRRTPRRRTAIVSSDEEVGSDSDERDYSSQFPRRARQSRPETPQLFDAEDSDLSSESEIGRQLDLIAAQERNIYGEDDSIPGPPARLRHLLNQPDYTVEELDNEESACGSDSDTDDGVGYGHDDRDPWQLDDDLE